MIDISSYKPLLIKAMIKLNRIKGLHLALINIKSNILLSFDILNIEMLDKDTNKKFDVNIWVDCFDQEFTGQRINGIDTRAGISKVQGRDKVIGRLAWCMFRDYYYYKSLRGNI